MSRDYDHYSYSVDLPRSSDFSITNVARQATGSKNDSVAATFGLGDIAQPDYKEYTVWNAALTNMRVCPVILGGGAYYYVENRSFIPKHPGVTLHSGTDRTGRTVGVANLDYFSTTNSIGLGDPDRNPMAVVWNSLHKESFWTHMRYSFQFTLEPSGETRTFEWHRTKNVYMLQDQGDLVLVEVGKMDVLAEYTGRGFLGQVKKERGNLKIMDREEFGPAWEVMVVLTWATIVELSRRRTRQSRVSSIFGRIV